MGLDKRNILIDKKVPKKLEDVILKFYKKYNTLSRTKLSNIKSNKLHAYQIIDLLENKKYDKLNLFSLVKYNNWQNYSDFKIVGLYTSLGKEIEFSCENNKIPDYLMKKENFILRRDNLYLLIKKKLILFYE